MSLTAALKKDFAPDERTLTPVLRLGLPDPVFPQRPTSAPPEVWLAHWALHVAAEPTGRGWFERAVVLQIIARGPDDCPVRPLYPEIADIMESVVQDLTADHPNLYRPLSGLYLLRPGFVAAPREVAEATGLSSDAVVNIRRSIKFYTDGALSSRPDTRRLYRGLP